MNGNAGEAAEPRGIEDPPGLLAPSLSGVPNVPECEDRLPKVSELMEGSDIAALRREGRMPRSAETTADNLYTNKVTLVAD